MAEQYSDGNHTGDQGRRLRERIRGLYPITPDLADDDQLFRLVEPVLTSGITVLQYRNKLADETRRRAQIQGLLTRCRQAGVLLIVNDDWRLALDLGAQAIHVGRDDGDPATIRQTVGTGVLIGVSCYASLDRARQLAPVADYLAFGAMFASGTKPQAPPAPLTVLAEARALGLPVVAIGGIDGGKLATVIRAGADAAAVIGAVFGTPAGYRESGTVQAATLALVEQARVALTGRAGLGRTEAQAGN